MSFKIAFIGAGSVGFTRRLLSDLLTVPEFHDIEVSFMDINPRNLDMVYRLCQRDIDENGLNIRIKPTLDRREAFRDAKYVINAVRVGMLEAFEKDIEVALRYGVDQCVGDTLAPGGIMYGQRGIPQILDFCRDIREVAAPGCLLLSYSNPCAMMTWAANKYGGVPTVGLCHGVQGGHWQIADALGYKQNEVDITAAGLNHQTWYITGTCPNTSRGTGRTPRRSTNGSITRAAGRTARRAGISASAARAATGSRPISRTGWPPRRIGSSPNSARRSTARTSSRRSRPDGCTAATSTS